MNIPIRYTTNRMIFLASVGLVGFAGISFVLASAGGDEPAEDGASLAADLDRLNASVAASASCVEANGIAVVRIPGLGLNPDSYTFTVPSDGEDGPPNAEVLAKAEACEAPLQNARVEYQRGRAPTQEQFEEWRSAFSDCIQDGGIPGTDVSAGFGSAGYASYGLGRLPVSIEQQQAVAECSVAFTQEHGLPAPAVKFTDLPSAND